MPLAKSHETNVGLILLAAGGSARLGRPKQLLAYRDVTLLQHSLQTATACTARPVVLVLGANAEALQKEIKEVNVDTVLNSAWQEGMASSIRCGLKAITERNPAVEGCLLMVCDQPYVTPELLNELIAIHQKTGKGIVACGYQDTFGPPVFFHQRFFQELLQLKGDTGARSIVREHPDMVDVIPFPEGTFDIDTEADYERIKTTTTNDQ